MDVDKLVKSLDRQCIGLSLDGCRRLLAERSVEELKLMAEYKGAGPWMQETVNYILTEKEKMTEVKTSVEDTLAQRGSRYGDFTDHAAVCQELKEVMTGCTKVNPEYPNQRIRGWQLLSSVQRQALEVIADKIARILSGDPNYDDNWHDIQGYAKLVEDRLPKPEGYKPPAPELAQSAMDKLLNTKGPGQ